MSWQEALDDTAISAMDTTSKVGLLATVNAKGQPHLTLITTLQARTLRQLMWGQFTEGLSKQHVLENPKTGFLVMTLDRQLWRGKALFTHLAKEGAEYEQLNKQPMFRYNTYFGIHTVYYMDLRETYGKEALPMPQIVASALLTRVAKTGPALRRRLTRWRAGDGTTASRILSFWAEGLFNKLDSLKFLSYVAGDGHPVIIPLVQCQALDSGRLIFAPLAYGQELQALTSGMQVAVFGMTLQMEDVLVRGRFEGYHRQTGVMAGTIQLEYVYNAMPPKQGQLYPPLELRPVTRF